MLKKKMDSQRVRLSARVLESDRNKLEKLAATTGKTVSQVTAGLIHSALSEGSGLNERLENIEKKVSVILDRLDDLSKDCIQLDPGLERSDLLGLNREAQEKPRKVKEKNK